MGCVTCRKALSKLLRFPTSKSGDGLASLDEIVARMKPGQKDLYFVATQTKEQAQSSPFVEKLAKKDLEVKPLCGKLLALMLISC